MVRLLVINLIAMFIAATTVAQNVDIAEMVRRYNLALDNKNVNVPQFRVLVSFSMPLTSLQQLAIDSARTQSSLILNGLINNSLQSTASAIAKVDKSKTASWQIDPRVFEQLSVASVPVFVISTGNQTEFVHGDVPISYALEQLANVEGEIGNYALSLQKLLQE